jgi:hypothetical protein
VAPLHGAVAFKHVHDVAVVVSKDLDLNVPRPLNEALNEHRPVAKRSQRLAAMEMKCKRCPSREGRPSTAVPETERRAAQT